MQLTVCLVLLCLIRLSFPSRLGGLRNSTFFQCLLLSVGSPFSCSLQSTSTVKFRYMHRAANLDRLVKRTIRVAVSSYLKGKVKKLLLFLTSLQCPLEYRVCEIGRSHSNRCCRNEEQFWNSCPNFCAASRVEKASFMM